MVTNSPWVKMNSVKESKEKVRQAAESRRFYLKEGASPFFRFGRENSKPRTYIAKLYSVDARWVGGIGLTGRDCVHLSVAHIEGVDEEDVRRVLRRGLDETPTFYG